MLTEKPGEDGTWAGQLGPVDMPPGPYVPAPGALPERVLGWRAMTDEGGGCRRFIASGGSAEITVELHHGGQPNLRGSSAAVVDGKVCCEMVGGPGNGPQCAVPFDGGYLLLLPEKGVTPAQAAELGNRLYAHAESARS